MRKTFTLIAALVMIATMAKAETTEMVANEASTDQGYLESKDALFAAPAPAADAEKDANYWAGAVGSRVKVMGYAQAGYTATFNEGNSSANTNTFDVKRAILMVAVDITKDFYAFFMHDFKSGTMQEYYMEYRPSKAMKFRFGQSKKELSMENPMSPTVLESIGPMSQGVMALCGGKYDATGTAGVYNGSGRDIGLTMYGDLFNDKLRYVVSVLNGNKINNVDDNNQKDIVAKLEYKFVPNFRVSLSGQKGYTGPKGSVIRSDRYAFGAEWKSKKEGTDYNLNRCTTVRAEALGGRDGDVHSFATYISAAIPVAKRLDVVSMVDYFNRNTDAKLNQTNVMGGLQYWIHKKCRLQAQYEYNFRSEAAGKNSSNIRTQVQVSF